MKAGTDTFLSQQLCEHRAAICEAWLERTLGFYAKEYGRFVRANRDPFANPVGAILREGLQSVLEALIDGADDERCREALLPVVRVKAVQEAPPSEALAFVPQLKSVVREIAAPGPLDETMKLSVAAFEARVDTLLLLAFDVYAACRRRIFDLRVGELKRNLAQVLRRSGAVEFEDDSNGRSGLVSEAEEGD